MVGLSVGHQCRLGASALSLPNTRFVRIDGVARRGSEVRQHLRTAQSRVCRARPSRAKGGFVRGWNSTRPWRKSCRISKLKSSSAPIRPKDLWCCQSAGSSSARSPGSIVAAGSPRIGKVSIERGSRSCASLQFASCLESSAIRPKLSGQTLRPFT